MDGLISASAVLIIWSVGLAQGLLEYKTAKAKKQVRIKAWWDTGVPLLVLGVGLLSTWGIWERHGQFADAYLTLSIGVTIAGGTMIANALIEKKRSPANRILMRERVKNAAMAAGIICIAVYVVYALIKIFTD